MSSGVALYSWMESRQLAKETVEYSVRDLKIRCDVAVLSPDLNLLAVNNENVGKDKFEYDMRANRFPTNLMWRQTTSLD